jgi:hypothetical protein
VRTLHNGSDRHRERLAAILALVDAGASALALQLGDPIPAHSATRAEGAEGPKYLFEMLARGIVIVEHRIAKIELYGGHFKGDLNGEAY